MSTAPTPVYEWNDLPWKAIEKRVFKPHSVAIPKPSTSSNDY